MTNSSYPAPAVAVCVPVYDKEEYLERTLRSVLQQTFTDFELVVLDNASRDRSLEVAKQFDDPRLLIVENDATIPALENFNKVVALSTAPLVKVLMADDVLHPTCLERQVEVMRSEPGVAVVSARHDAVDDEDTVISRDRVLRTPDLIGRHGYRDVLRRVVRHGGNPLGGPTNVLFRRSAFEAAGGFPLDEDFFTTDVSTWLHLSREGDFYGIPESLCDFRLSAGSNSSKLRSEAVRIQRRWIRDLRRREKSQLSAGDVVHSMVRAPLTSLRHHLLFAAAGPHGRTQRVAGGILGVARRARSA